MYHVSRFFFNIKKIINFLFFLALIQPQTPAYVEISHADSTLTSLETGSLSAEQQSSYSDDNLSDDNNNIENYKNKKLVTNSIYTNNVSSLDNYNIYRPNDEVLSTIGPQYSVDLSHASKDPMISGPKELFNKNVREYLNFFLIFNNKIFLLLNRM
jgi:hypothetical protein